MMKYLSLFISVALTLLVWSLSLQSGETSVALSSSITTQVHRFIIQVFPGLDVTVDQLHAIIRKTAHVTEYMILALAWIVTASQFGYRHVIGPIIVFAVALVDEGIQMFVAGRGPSLIDVFVFDLGGILLASGLAFLCVERRKRKETMLMTSEILTQVNQQKMKPAKAYKTLYRGRPAIRRKKPKRAHFIKIKIITDDKTANRFLRFFLWMPIPLCFLSLFKRQIKKKDLDDVPISVDEMFEMLRYKGINIDVESSDGTVVKVKTI